MKILYVVTSLEVGGAEKIVISLANEFSKDYEVAIAVLKHNSPLVELLNDNIRLHYCDLSINNPIKSVRNIVNLQKEISAAHVTHCHMFHPSVIASLISRKKHVLTYHTSNFPLMRKILYFLLRKRRNCDVAIYPKNHGIWSANNVKVIPNAIKYEVKHTRGKKNKLYKLCFCGTLNSNKGIIELIQDLAHSRIHDKIELHIIGHGPLLSDVKKLQKNLSGKLVIKVYGLLHNVQSVMVHCDTLLIYSKREGLPMVAIEAALCGLSVISTPCGGMSWLLDEERGIISVRGNRYMQAIESYVLNYELSKNSARKLEEFVRTELSFQKFISNHLKVYKSICEY